jgi:putative NADH-flavin reductase
MKIVIFGANGKVGTQLVKQALENGDDVIAYIREACSLKIEHPKLKIFVGNLNETLKLRDAISGSDACISALIGGSLIHHATTVIAGIENITSIMIQEKVHRFIYLSCIGVGESQYLIPQPKRFYTTKILKWITLADHNTNELLISKSNLDWIVIRPGKIIDGPASGNLVHGIEKKRLKWNPTISRTSLASFMLRQIVDDTYLMKRVWLYE